MINSDLSFDILILGAGAAGVAAAVAAASSGLRVCIVERNTYAGGKATASEVGTICGLYHYSKFPEAAYITSGYAKEFAEKLRIRSLTAPMHNSEGLHYLPYDINTFKELCLEEIRKHSITCFFNYSLLNVAHDSHNIESVTIQNNTDKIRIKLKAVIDCSGESAISQIGGFPMIKNNHYQSAAQVFIMDGIEEVDESRLSLILLKAVKSAIRDNILPESFERINIVQGSLKNKRIHIKLGLPMTVTYEPGNIEALGKLANVMIRQLTEFLCNTVPAFYGSKLEHIAPEVGTRVGFRTAGRYTLMETDVLQCKKFTDAIANGSWPVEEWIEQKRVRMQYFELNDFYQIPAGCIQSSTIKNLFMGGRMIAASQTAIASARVIGTCLQTGFAAGILALGFIQKIPLEESIEKIKNSQL